MAIDPRLLDPNYWASLPTASNGGLAFGSAALAGIGGLNGFPNEIHYSMFPQLEEGLKGGFFPKFDSNYIQNNVGWSQWNPDFFGEGIPQGSDPSQLVELSQYFNFDPSDSVFSSLSPGVQDYLSRVNPGGAGNQQPLSPQQIAALFSQQDYANIDSAIQPFRTAEQLYANEFARRVQSGGIDVGMPNNGIMGSIMAQFPAILGAAVGGPIGGAIGGALSGGLSGGGLKGAALGALGGGIAGNGGLGKTLGGLGGSTGGAMNTITSAIRGMADSQLNPFGWLGGGIQDIFGGGMLGQTLGTAATYGGPGALLGGALGGWDGALYGGLAGAGLGLGMNGYLGDWASGLFNGSGGASGGAGGGTGGFGGAGGAGGFGGALGGLFGGGGNTLAQLLGAGIPLALLTREASKVSDTPTSLRTPYSSVRDGFTNFDPTIRNAFLDTMDKSYGLFNQAGGNQGAFVQARVNPLMQQIAQRQGQLEQSLGRRGVAGSSFGDQALNVFGLDSQRALGDARALATQEGLAMQGQFNQQLAAGGEQMLRQELGALGLADQNIQNLLARAKIRSDIFGRAAAGAGDILSGFR